MQIRLHFRSSLHGGSDHIRTPLLQMETFHLVGINNSFLADLRTSFIKNTFKIKPEDSINNMQGLISYIPEAIIQVVPQNIIDHHRRNR
jgi:hypothetical protein